MWEGKNMCLRQVEFTDLKTLLSWENNPDNWEVSGTTHPYTEEEMIDFIVEQSDYQKTRQLRLMICLKNNREAIGAIDLFEIDNIQQTAGVGILISDETNRNKGYATEALELLKKIAGSQLGLLSLYCSIHSNNTNSIKLFTGCSFIKQSVNNEIEYYFCQLSNELKTI